MITKIFSVYDSKAAVFGTPFFMPKEGMAIRAFSDLANDKATMVGKYPTDFSLFEVGEFDDEKGIVASTMHKPLGMATSFVKFEPSGIEDIDDLNRKRANGKLAEVK